MSSNININNTNHNPQLLPKNEFDGTHVRTPVKLVKRPSLTSENLETMLRIETTAGHNGNNNNNNNNNHNGDTDEVNRTNSTNNDHDKSRRPPRHGSMESHENDDDVAGSKGKNSHVELKSPGTLSQTGVNFSSNRSGVAGVFSEDSQRQQQHHHQPVPTTTTVAEATTTTTTTTCSNSPWKQRARPESLVSHHSGTNHDGSPLIGLIGFSATPTPNNVSSANNSSASNSQQSNNNNNNQQQQLQRTGAEQQSYLDAPPNRLVSQSTNEYRPENYHQINSNMNNPSSTTTNNSPSFIGDNIDQTSNNNTNTRFLQQQPGNNTSITSNPYNRSGTSPAPPHHHHQHSSTSPNNNGIPRERLAVDQNERKKRNRSHSGIGITEARAAASGNNTGARLQNFRSALAQLPPETTLSSLLRGSQMASVGSMNNSFSQIPNTSFGNNASFTLGVQVTSGSSSGNHQAVQQQLVASRREDGSFSQIGQSPALNSSHQLNRVGGGDSSVNTGNNNNNNMNDHGLTTTGGSFSIYSNNNHNSNNNNNINSVDLRAVITSPAVGGGRISPSQRLLRGRHSAALLGQLIEGRLSQLDGGDINNNMQHQVMSTTSDNNTNEHSNNNNNNNMNTLSHHNSAHNTSGNVNIFHGLSSLSQNIGGIAGSSGVGGSNVSAYFQNSNNNNNQQNTNNLGIPHLSPRHLLSSPAPSHQTLLSPNVNGPIRNLSFGARSPYSTHHLGATGGGGAGGANSQQQQQQQQHHNLMMSAHLSGMMHQIMTPVAPVINMFMNLDDIEQIPDDMGMSTMSLPEDHFMIDAVPMISDTDGTISQQTHGILSDDDGGGAGDGNSNHHLHQRHSRNQGSEGFRYRQLQRNQQFVIEDEHDHDDIANVADDDDETNGDGGVVGVGVSGQGMDRMQLAHNNRRALRGSEPKEEIEPYLEQVHESHLTALLLSQLEINIVPERILSFTWVRSITLAHNNITSIPEELFTQLPLLESCDLSENRIRSVPDSIFKCRSLLSLMLDHNDLKDFGDGNVEASDWDLCNLTELGLEWNDLENFPANAIKFLPNIQKLYLAENPSMKFTEEHLEILFVSSNARDVEIMNRRARARRRGQRRMSSGAEPLEETTSSGTQQRQQQQQQLPLTTSHNNSHHNNQISQFEVWNAGHAVSDTHSHHGMSTMSQPRLINIRSSIGGGDNDFDSGYGPNQAFNSMSERHFGGGVGGGDVGGAGVTSSHNTTLSFQEGSQTINPQQLLQYNNNNNNNRRLSSEEDDASIMNQHNDKIRRSSSNSGGRGSGGSPSSGRASGPLLPRAVSTPSRRLIPNVDQQQQRQQQDYDNIRSGGMIVSRAQAAGLSNVSSNQNPHSQPNPNQSLESNNVTSQNVFGDIQPHMINIINNSNNNNNLNTNHASNIQARLLQSPGVDTNGQHTNSFVEDDGMPSPGLDDGDIYAHTADDFLSIRLDNNPIYKDMLGNETVNNLRIDKCITIDWNEIFPDKILDNLFLGALKSVQSASVFDNVGITHVLTAARDIPVNPVPGIVHKQLLLDDFPGEDITRCFDEAHEFINSARCAGCRRRVRDRIIGEKIEARQNAALLADPQRNREDIDVSDILNDPSLPSAEPTGVVVHCFQGASRSATIVVSYLMRMLDLPFVEAFSLARTRRPQVNPNSGYIANLRRYERYLLEHDGRLLNATAATYSNSASLSHSQQSNSHSRLSPSIHNGSSRAISPTPTSTGHAAANDTTCPLCNSAHRFCARPNSSANNNNNINNNNSSHSNSNANLNNINNNNNNRSSTSNSNASNNVNLTLQELQQQEMARISNNQNIRNSNSVNHLMATTSGQTPPQSRSGASPLSIVQVNSYGASVSSSTGLDSSPNHVNSAVATSQDTSAAAVDGHHHFGFQNNGNNNNLSTTSRRNNLNTNNNNNNNNNSNIMMMHGDDDSSGSQAHGLRLISNVSGDVSFSASMQLGPPGAFESMTTRPPVSPNQHNLSGEDNYHHHHHNHSSPGQSNHHHHHHASGGGMGSGIDAGSGLLLIPPPSHHHVMNTNLISNSNMVSNRVLATGAPRAGPTSGLHNGSINNRASPSPSPDHRGEELLLLGTSSPINGSTSQTNTSLRTQIFSPGAPSRGLVRNDNSLDGRQLTIDENDFITIGGGGGGSGSTHFQTTNTNNHTNNNNNESTSQASSPSPMNRSTNTAALAAGSPIRLVRKNRQQSTLGDTEGSRNNIFSTSSDTHENNGDTNNVVEISNNNNKNHHHQLVVSAGSSTADSSPSNGSLPFSTHNTTSSFPENNTNKDTLTSISSFPHILPQSDNNNHQQNQHHIMATTAATASASSANASSETRQSSSNTSSTSSQQQPTHHRQQQQQQRGFIHVDQIQEQSNINNCFLSPSTTTTPPPTTSTATAIQDSHRLSSPPFQQHQLHQQPRSPTANLAEPPAAADRARSFSRQSMRRMMMMDGDGEKSSMTATASQIEDGAGRSDSTMKFESEVGDGGDNTNNNLTKMTRSQSLTNNQATLVPVNATSVSSSTSANKQGKNVVPNNNNNNNSSSSPTRNGNHHQPQSRNTQGRHQYNHQDDDDEHFDDEQPVQYDIGDDLKILPHGENPVLVTKRNSNNNIIHCSSNTAEAGMSGNNTDNSNSNKKANNLRTKPSVSPPPLQSPPSGAIMIKREPSSIRQQSMEAMKKGSMRFLPPIDSSNNGNCSANNHVLSSSPNANNRGTNLDRPTSTMTMSRNASFFGGDANVGGGGGGGYAEHHHHHQHVRPNSQPSSPRIGSLIMMDTINSNNQTESSHRGILSPQQQQQQQQQRRQQASSIGTHSTLLKGFPSGSNLLTSGMEQHFLDNSTNHNNNNNNNMLQHQHLYHQSNTARGNNNSNNNPSNVSLEANFLPPLVVHAHEQKEASTRLFVGGVGNQQQQQTQLQHPTSSRKSITAANSSLNNGLSSPSSQQPPHHQGFPNVVASTGNLLPMNPSPFASRPTSSSVTSPQPQQQNSTLTVSPSSSSSVSGSASKGNATTNNNNNINIHQPSAPVTLFGAQSLSGSQPNSANNSVFNTINNNNHNHESNNSGNRVVNGGGGGRASLSPSQLNDVSTSSQSPGSLPKRSPLSNRLPVS